MRLTVIHTLMKTTMHKYVYVLFGAKLNNGVAINV